ncbi:MAG: bifunctional oligoribonuclease/PAP phosphatase NrnA [Clostridiales bacterium]|nr:bifunctional oligoribonuclease/PAP phosphatase NrnA [Clostridiales bacterium]
MELIRRPEEIARLIREAQTIALCSHVNPDGDTVGSVLALKLGLERLGKQVSVFCQDKIPGTLGMLPGAGEFRRESDQRFDLLLCVDVSDKSRMGDCQQLLMQAERTAQIDHHGTNPCYMQVNSVDEDAPATGLLIKEQLDALDVTIDREIAMCLYAAISTDTGNFAFKSTNAEAFSVMSQLMDCGLPLDEMNRVLFRQRQKPHVCLLARALSSMRFHSDDSITTMQLTHQDFLDCQALPEHADAIVNYGVDIPGVRMALLARENDDGSIKMALRAVAPARVDEIARGFGGGGHAQASGCTVELPMAQAVEEVLNAMQNTLS